MKILSTMLICPHYPHCPSCSLLDERIHPPIYLEAKKYFRENHFLDFPLHTDLLIRYRSRVKLAVRGTKEKPEFGLFSPGTHELVDASRCIAHEETIEEGIRQIKDLLKEFPIEPYQENGKGILRYIQITAQRETGKLQLVFVITKREKEVYSFLETLNQRSSHWHSIWINVQPLRTNSIFSDDWEKISGESYLSQKIAKRNFAYHPASFSQVHLPLFEKMLMDMAYYVKPDTSLVELYAGMGIMGLTLAEKCRKVILVEKNPFSLLSFEETIKKFPKEIQNKVSFLNIDVKDQNLFSSCDMILVDPPRKGLDASLKKLLASLNSNVKLLYVSCNFASFSRDTEELIKAGYQLKKVEGYLFFPGTNHIEILGYFEK